MLKFSFTDMARQVADALVDTHRRISSGELTRPNGVWQDLREAMQRTQSPRVLGSLLRQELRRGARAVLRKLGVLALARGALMKMRRQNGRPAKRCRDVRLDGR